MVADGAARARFTLRAGQTTAFVLEAVPHTAVSRPTRNGTAGGIAPSATGRRPFTARSAVARWRAIPMRSDRSALALAAVASDVERSAVALTIRGRAPNARAGVSSKNGDKRATAVSPRAASLRSAATKGRLGGGRGGAGPAEPALCPCS